MKEERSERITVRLSPSEEEWIVKKAEKGGVSKSRYMRKVVLGELPQVDVPFRKEDRRLQFKNGVSQRDMEKILDHDLAKWGSNLNQIARKLNEGAPADDKIVQQMEDIRKGMDRITDTILTALG